MMLNNNYYKDLGLNKDATTSEIKSAYRKLAKKYHPDTGGNKEKFLSIQLAWETLNDPNKKREYDRHLSFESHNRKEENKIWSSDLRKQKNDSSVKDNTIKYWIHKTYEPSNIIISQIIKPLNNEIKKLSADPYDDELMEQFCLYIKESRKKIDKVSLSYKAQSIPDAISQLGLDLYHCFSQVQDALDQLDRYTQGYVDEYLFDGKEMMKEAKHIQERMKVYKNNISF